MVSKKIEELVNKIFPASECSLICEFLEKECSNSLPLVKSDGLTEQIQMAVIKNSCGDSQRLLIEISNANRDWRDVLVAAGFGNNLKQHLAWYEQEITNK